MQNIFADTAPKYWAAGLPAIPLYQMEKRPVSNGWSRWCDEMVSPVEQAEFLQKYPKNNIGLPLGQASGLMMIDYDYDDPEVEKALLSVLPPSPWKRVGQRGYVLAYKWNGMPGKKVINDAQDRVLVEILTTGNQVVLPPSIHPKTMKPYVTENNVELCDVLDQLVTLPVDIEEQLRSALSQVVGLKESSSKTRFKATVAVPAGSRDTSMTRNAGLLVHSILSGDLTLLEAIDDMQAWYDMYVQKNAVDDIDIHKGLQHIIKWLLNDVNVKKKILPTGWDDGISEETKAEWGLVFDEDQKALSYEQMLEAIDKEWSTVPPNDPKRLSFTTKMLSLIHRANNLSQIELDMVIKHLCVGGDMKPATLKKTLKEIGKGVIEGLSHYEIANQVVKEMNVKHGELALYNDVIWSWEGSYWQEVKEQMIRQYVQREYGNLVAAKKFQDHKGIVNVLKDIIPQTIKAEVEVVGVNFSNGFLNREMKLVPHAKEHGMTYRLPFSYKPELAGKSAMFFSFLEHSWGHEADFEDKKRALQEAICTTLFGVATSYQRAFLLYGVGGTGKSVLMDIISAMVPEASTSSIKPTQWDGRWEKAMFGKSLLNQAGELSEREFIDGTMFKQIVVGEVITGEFKGGQLFQLRPKTAHWFASNYLPKTKDHSEGFNRRWLIFNFNRVVAPEDRIIDLANKIVYEEIEMIVAWALEAWPALVKREGYTLCASHKDKVKDMALQNSSIRQWMSERVILNVAGAKVDEKTLYSDFWKFSMQAMGAKVLQPKTFNIEFNQFLGEIGIEQGVSTGQGVIMYKDIALVKD